MELLQKYLGTRFSFYSIAALTCALLIVYGVFHIKLQLAAAEVTSLKGELSTCHASITVQNAAVKNFAANCTERSGRADAAAAFSLVESEKERAKILQSEPGVNSMNAFFGGI